MKRISKTDIAYIAGFFDGEGCISIAMSKHIRISISQKFPGVLHYIKNLLGYGKVVPTYKNRAYQFKIYGRDNYKKFIQTILPFSKVKKEQLKVGLELLALLGKPGWPRITEANLNHRRRLNKKLRELKRKESVWDSRRTASLSNPF